MLNKWFHTEMENKMEKGEKQTWPSHLKHAFYLLSIHKGTIEQCDGFRPSGIGMQSMKLNARGKTEKKAVAYRKHGGMKLVSKNSGKIILERGNKAFLIFLRYLPFPLFPAKFTFLTSDSVSLIKYLRKVVLVPRLAYSLSRLCTTEPSNPRKKQFSARSESDTHRESFSALPV